MALEIERKFKVKNTEIIKGLQGTRFLQAYLSKGAVLVRVRVSEGWAKLTLKSARVGLGACHEWEYEIPREDALVMARQPGAYSLEKTRFLIEHEGHTFEVDQYHGGLTGLYTVEVELDDIAEAVALPDWIGEEVTGQRGWDNESLAINGWPTE